MVQYIFDKHGEKIGVCIGDIGSGKIYDDRGRYLGRFYDHVILNSEGMLKGYYNGNLLEAFKLLMVDYLLH